MKRPLVVLLITAVALAACGGDDGTSAQEDQPAASPAGERPSSTGAITIVQPVPGEVYDRDSIPVVIELEGAELSEEVSTDLAGDHGHMHLSLDGELLTLLGSLEEDLVDLSGGPLEPGQHVLEAEFVASDHGFFNPRVVKTVAFTVE